MSDFDIVRFIDRLRRKKRSYVFSRSTRKKDKKNDINSLQNKLRPDATFQGDKVNGLNKKRINFDSSVSFNEGDY